MLAIRFIQTAVVFFVVGAAMGLCISVMDDSSLQSVYEHVTLMGWGSMALIGLIYFTFPQLQRGWVPFLHYWLHTAGLVLFTGGLVWRTLPGILPDLAFLLLPRMVVSGALMIGVGVLMFAINIQSQLRTTRHW